MDSELQAFINTIRDSTSVASECICYACVKQIARNRTNPAFKPRWLPKAVDKRCCVSLCKNTWRTNTTTPIDQLEEILCEKVVAMSVNESATTVGLCKEHYNIMYSKWRITQKCTSCGANGKRGEKFNRHCPAPDVISLHLNSIIDEQKSLTTDIVCLPCYKYFQSVIVHRASIQTQQTHSIENAISTCTVQSKHDYVEMIMFTHRLYLWFTTAKMVAEHIHNNEANLLSCLQAIC